MKSLNIMRSFTNFPGTLGNSFILLFLLWSPWTQAGSFSVSPVRVTLSTSAPISAITVQNDGKESVVVQLEAMAWAQQAGKDVYTPSSDILATPPIITIPAGGSQILRVGLRRTPDPQRELTYRMYLQEVPPPPKPGSTGVQVALRLGLPVFVAPVAEQPVAALVWGISRVHDGKHQVSLKNSGNSHVQVANFKLVSADGSDLGTQQVAGYVLAGQTVNFQAKDIKAPASGGQLRLVAQTDVGQIDSGLMAVDGVAASNSPTEVGSIDSGTVVAEPK